MNKNVELMVPSQFLIAARHRNKWKSIGSCILLKLNDRYFLITAAHVMNERHNAEDNALYLLFDADNQKIKILIEEDIVGYDSHDPESIPDSYDIAVIELKRERYEVISEERFLTLEQIFLKDKVHGKAIYAISGYLNSQNNSFQLQNRKNKILVVFTEKIKKNDLFTISLSYHKSDFKENPPKPKGISGGGVWIISNSTNLKPKLIGIFISCDMKQCNVVKISYALSLIKGFFKGTILDKIDLPFEHIEEKESCKLLVDDTTLRNQMLKDVMTELSKQMADIYFSGK